MAYVARYGHQQWSEMLRMPPRELLDLQEDLEEILRRENGESIETDFDEDGP